MGCCGSKEDQKFNLNLNLTLSNVNTNTRNARLEETIEAHKTKKNINIPFNEEIPDPEHRNLNGNDQVFDKDVQSKANKIQRILTPNNNSSHTNMNFGRETGGFGPRRTPPIEKVSDVNILTNVTPKQEGANQNNIIYYKKTVLNNTMAKPDQSQIDTLEVPNENEKNQNLLYENNNLISSIENPINSLGVPIPSIDNLNDIKNIPVYQQIVDSQESSVQPVNKFSKKEMNIKGTNSYSQDFFSKQTISNPESNASVRQRYEVMNKKAMENCKHLFVNSNKRNRDNSENFSIMHNDSTLSRINHEKINANSFYNNNSSLNTINKEDTVIPNSNTSDIKAIHRYRNSLNINNDHFSAIRPSHNRNSFKNFHGLGNINASTNINTHTINISNSNYIGNVLSNSNNNIKLGSSTISNDKNLKQNYSNSNIFGGRTRRQILNMNSNSAVNDAEMGTERNLQNKIQETNENVATHGSFISNYGTSMKPNNLNNLSKYKHIFTDSSINTNLNRINNENTQSNSVQQNNIHNNTVNK